MRRKKVRTIRLIETDDDDNDTDDDDDNDDIFWCCSMQMRDRF